MDVHAAYLPARRGGVEGLIVYLAYLVAVDGVGKVRAEALKVEQLRPAAYLLVDKSETELDETRCKAALAPLTLAEMELKDEMNLPT